MSIFVDSLNGTEPVGVSYHFHLHCFALSYGVRFSKFLFVCSFHQGYSALFEEVLLLVIFGLGSS